MLLALVACVASASSTLLPACAGGSGAPRTPSVAPIQRVLVFPLNVVVALPTDVESGLAPLSEELRAQLEARGLEILSIELSQARAEWLQSAVALKAQVGTEGMSFDAAASILAKKLAAEQSFDALILPAIVVGPAPMKTAGVVSWDGVRRRLQLAQVESERRSSWAFKRFRERFTGVSVPASSFTVAVFSSAGEKLCVGAGGLELLVELSLAMEASAVHYEWVPRPVIFDDRDHLREGISLALGSCLDPAPGAAP